jgi:hypothetical protein
MWAQAKRLGVNVLIPGRDEARHMLSELIVRKVVVEYEATTIFAAEKTHNHPGPFRDKFNELKMHFCNTISWNVRKL